MTDRRGFLGAMLAAAAAPAFVKAGVLMPVRDTRLILWGDGIHDDTQALQAALDGFSVRVKVLCSGTVISDQLFQGFTAKISDTIHLRREGLTLRNLNIIGDDSMKDKPCIYVPIRRPASDSFGGGFSFDA